MLPDWLFEGAMLVVEITLLWETENTFELFFVIFALVVSYTREMFLANKLSSANLSKLSDGLFYFGFSDGFEVVDGLCPDWWPPLFL